MAIQSRTEFASALNQVCSERGIEPEVVLDSIKQAILAAYRKDYGEPEGINIDLNADSGEVTLTKGKKAVTPPGFGRIAAQTAKQVILQRIREAERNAIMGEYSSKIGTIVSGIIQRISGPVITVNLGKAEGIMPPGEQARGENYFVNQRLKFYVVGIKEGTHGEEIIVSRSANGLLENLFKQEVPEVAQGSVVLKVVAREAGSRSKVAVFSNQIGVDPVGSCVGQKGVRVQAVTNELSGEKIDIIAYQEDPAEFIKAALSPAKDLQVKIDEKENTAEVTSPDDQLSLAIGKEGQNVRLAAKLTGYRIDIRGKSGTPKEVEAKEKAAVAKAKAALGVTDEQIKSKHSEKSDSQKVSKSDKPEKPQPKADRPLDEKEKGTAERKESKAAGEDQSASQSPADQGQSDAKVPEEPKEPEQNSPEPSGSSEKSASDQISSDDHKS